MKRPIDLLKDWGLALMAPKSPELEVFRDTKVFKYSEIKYKEVYEGDIPSLILFPLGPKGPELEVFGEAAKANDGKMVYTYADMMGGQ